MTRKEMRAFLDEVIGRVGLINAKDEDMRIALLKIAHDIICKVQELREASFCDGAACE